MPRSREQGEKAELTWDTGPTAIIIPTMGQDSQGGKFLKERSKWNKHPLLLSFAAQCQHASL